MPDTAASRCLCAERGLLGVHEEPCAGFGSRSDELCEQAEREARAAGDWPEHPAASPSLTNPCPKCAPGYDVNVSYHPRRSYCEPYSRYTFNSSDSEHLHYTCRNCGYDWTGDVADAAA